MREDLISSHWPQLRDAFRKHWPELTDVDLAADDGDVGDLIHALRHRYDIDRFEAWKQIHEFQPNLWFFEEGGRVEACLLKAGIFGREESVNEDKIKGQWERFEARPVGAS